MAKGSVVKGGYAGVMLEDITDGRREAENPWAGVGQPSHLLLLLLLPFLPPSPPPRSSPSSFPSLSSLVRQAGQPEVARQLIAELRLRYAPDVITYNIDLYSCQLLDDHARARAIWQEFKDSGLVPDHTLLCSLMKALGAEPDKNKVRGRRRGKRSFSFVREGRRDLVW